MKAFFTSFLVAALSLAGCGGMEINNSVMLQQAADGSVGPFTFDAAMPIQPNSIAVYHDDAQTGHDVATDGTGTIVDLDGTNTIIDAASSVDYNIITNAISITYTAGNAPPAGTALIVKYKAPVFALHSGAL